MDDAEFNRRFKSAESFRVELKGIINDKITNGGMTGAEIAWGLVYNVVLQVYVDNLGNRGRARDSLSKLMDSAFDDVENAVLSNPRVVGYMKAAELAFKNHDERGVKELMAKITADRSGGVA